MSCFFPSGVSAMINESPPCPGRINGFRRFKTILAAVGLQEDSVRMFDLLRGYCTHPAACLPVYRRRVMLLRGLALALESVGGGFDGLAESGRQGRPGSWGIGRGRTREGSGQMGRLATQPSPRDRGVRR